jgi:hypothetical protein
MTSETDYYNKFVEENPATFDSTTLGCDPKMDKYLANRMHHAFTEGAAAGRALERKRIIDQLVNRIIGHSS